LTGLGDLIFFPIFWQESSGKLQETYDQVLINNFNLTLSEAWSGVVATMPFLK
jgi:hypothetical protein